MEVSEKDIHKLQVCIRDHSKYDFTDYSMTSLRRRLTRILLEYEMDMDQVVKKIKQDAKFAEKTIAKLTVHTTELFRDPVIWQKIREELFPLWQDKSSINIWHSGCSTGQEVYSMMMFLDAAGLLQRANVFASDLSEPVLEIAEKGKYRYYFNQSYLENFEKVMGNKGWNNYFSIDEARDQIQMKHFLCSKPVYKKLDLVKDSNLFLVNFDLIVCRNVIIYFNNQLQNRVFRLFHQNLAERGRLLLGVHESILGPYASRFKKLDPFYLMQS